MACMNRKIANLVKKRGYEYKSMEVLTKKCGIGKVAKFLATVKYFDRITLDNSNYFTIKASMNFYLNMYRNDMGCYIDLKEQEYFLRKEKAKCKKITAHNISELYIKTFGEYLNG